MFGTIGHATLKPGREADLRALFAEWEQTVRPLIPGSFVELQGHRAGRPLEVVFVALAQDEAAYRTLAELPEQHAMYLRLRECFTSDIAWEDVEMEWASQG